VISEPRVPAPAACGSASSREGTAAALSARRHPQYQLAESLGGLGLLDEFALDHDLDLVVDGEFPIRHQVEGHAEVLPVDLGSGAVGDPSLPAAIGRSNRMIG
jgi:hypothetical protein